MWTSRCSGRTGSEHRAFEPQITTVAGTTRHPRRGLLQSYPAWQASWAVFQNTMISIRAARKGALDHYAQGIKWLMERCPNSWALVAEADHRMRQERWSLMLELGLANGTRSQGPDTWTRILYDSAYSGVSGPMANFWDRYVVVPHDKGQRETSRNSAPQAPRGQGAPRGASLRDDPPRDEPRPSAPGPAPKWKPTPKLKGKPPVQRLGNLTCWNCNQPGHAWRDCKLPLRPEVAAKGQGRGPTAKPVKPDAQGGPPPPAEGPGADAPQGPKKKKRKGAPARGSQPPHY